MKTILLIGFGHHAKRIYYRVLQEHRNQYQFVIVELEDKRKAIEQFLKNKDFTPIKILYLTGNNRQEKKWIVKLNELQKQYNGVGVIIATDPQYHALYGSWAQAHGLPVLMDKPISVYDQLSTDPTVSKKLIQDYQKLAKKHSRRAFFSIVSQRRFHPAFQKARKLVEEVFEKTNCPITSIQITHSDGQWRLPNEIIDIPYHSFGRGYGKCSHSGYHFFDILSYFLEPQNGSTKKSDNVEIFSNFVRPTDFFGQVNLSDYRHIFPKFDQYNPYNQRELEKKTTKFGEIDAFVNLSFKKGKHTMTVATLNLIHNGFSQRGTLHPNEDLYKGNGRVRHESYVIEQGPFQAIHIDSLQSKEIDPAIKPGFEYGGEYHFDVHVFRNSSYNKKWKNYEYMSLNQLSKHTMEGRSRGHQEDARRAAVLEFLNFIDGKQNKSIISDLSKHENTVTLLAGAYQSAALKFRGKNPIVNLPLKPAPK